MMLILLFALCVTSSSGFVSIGSRAARERRLSSNDQHRPFAKLPKIAEPTHYLANLKIDTADNVFTGAIRIWIRALTNEKKIIIHSRDLTITEYNIFLPDGPSSNIKITNLEYDTIHDQAIFSLSRPLVPGTVYRLAVDYNGKFRNEEQVGMYSFASCEGKPKHLWAVLTQFECNYARTVFPSFDEPNYKATWELNIVHPRFHRARSNGVLIKNEHYQEDSSYEISYFSPTSKISSYLVAISLEPISYYRTQQTKAATKFGEIAIEFAYPICFDHEVPKVRLDHAAETIARFTDYFDMSMNLTKLDFVLGQHKGGMENSGMITVKQNFSKGEGGWPILDEHEISHQWTGNLVTVADWSEFWAQEGLTNFMQRLSVIDDPVQNVMGFDKAFALAIPLTVKDIANMNTVAPDGHLYFMGAQLFRMIYAVVGPDAFRNALRLYMNKNPLTATSWDGNFLPQFEEAWSESSDHRGFIQLLRDVPTMEIPLTILVDTSSTDWIIKPKNKISGSYEIPILARTLSDSKDTVHWMNSDKLELRIASSDVLFFDARFFGYYRIEHTANAFDRMFGAAEQQISRETCITISRVNYDMKQQKHEIKKQMDTAERIKKLCEPFRGAKQ